MFPTLVVVIGCHKCSNEPGMSCSLKLFAVHLLFDVITEQINDDDDDDEKMFRIGKCETGTVNLFPEPFGGLGE